MSNRFWNFFSERPSPSRIRSRCLNDRASIDSSWSKLLTRGHAIVHKKFSDATMARVDTTARFEYQPKKAPYDSTPSETPKHNTEDYSFGQIPSCAIFRPSHHYTVRMSVQSQSRPQTATTTTSSAAAAVGSPSDASAKLAEAIDDFLGDVEKKFKNISDEILTKRKFNRDSRQAGTDGTGFSGRYGGALR